MALALAQYEDLFQIVSGYLYGARGGFGLYDLDLPRGCTLVPLYFVSHSLEGAFMLIDGETLSALTCQMNL